VRNPLLTRALPERLRDDRLIISAIQIRLLLVVWYNGGICNISLQDMSLTHIVLNDNFVLKMWFIFRYATKFACTHFTPLCPLFAGVSQMNSPIEQSPTSPQKPLPVVICRVTPVSDICSDCRRRGLMSRASVYYCLQCSTA